MSRRSSSPTVFAGAAPVIAVDPNAARKVVVGMQRKTEEDLVQMLADSPDSQVMLVNLVKSMVTPMHVPLDMIEENGGLWVLKDDAELPEGLVKPEVIKDPAALSTVLGRRVTLENLLKTGRFHMVVVTIDANRKQIGSDAYIDDAEVQELLEAYPDQILVRKVSKEEYDNFDKANPPVPAATYESNGAFPTAHTVMAAQANEDPTLARAWGFSSELANPGNVARLTSSTVDMLCKLEILSAGQSLMDLPEAIKSMSDKPVRALAAV